MFTTTNAYSNVIGHLNLLSKVTKLFPEKRLLKGKLKVKDPELNGANRGFVPLKIWKNIHS